MSVSKTDAARRVGSNPTPGTIFLNLSAHRLFKIDALHAHWCTASALKQNARSCRAIAARLMRKAGALKQNADVAQLVEQRTRNA